MKSRILMNLGVVVILSVILTSCFDVDSDDQTYEEEIGRLNEYIAGLESEGNDVDTTALGVYYVTMEEGTGDYPVIGDSVTVSYSGFLMDGSLFDTSVRNATDTTWTFEVGEQTYISGWNDGLRVINKGAKVQLMIPSTLAYGENGYGNIPPNNSLIFVVRMVDIKKQ